MLGLHPVHEVDEASAFRPAQLDRVHAEVIVGVEADGVTEQVVFPVLHAFERLEELDRKLAELRRYRRELKQTLDAWNQQGEAEGVICGLIEGLDSNLTNGGASAKTLRTGISARRNKPSRSSS